MKNWAFCLNVVLAMAATTVCLAVGATEHGPNLIVNGDFNITQTTLPDAANNAASDAGGFSCEGWSADWVWADYQQAVNPNFVTATPVEKVPRGMVVFLQQRVLIDDYSCV